MVTQQAGLPLKPRRQQILEAIEYWWWKHGYAPTLAELMDLTDVTSKSVMAYNLRALRESGLIAYEDGHARTVRLVEA